IVRRIIDRTEPITHSNKSSMTKVQSVYSLNNPSHHNQRSVKTCNQVAYPREITHGDYEHESNESNASEFRNLNH
ncbi:hypothetical protein M758_UG322600, partial [Ceratodon purpureus]